MADTKRRRRSSRNRRSGGNPRNYSQLYKDDNTISTTAAGSSSPAATPAADTALDWQEEYGYVFNDLRLLLIVSVVIFALMIGAGLLLG